MESFKRRTASSDVFPKPAAVIRLADSVLVETHDEWQAGDRRYLSEASMALLNKPANTIEEVAPPALLTA